MQIAKLEEKMGGVLFHRIGRKLTLTAKGEQLLTYATQILDLADEALHTVANEDEPSGLLTIAAPETLCAYHLPAAIQQFRARFPHVNIRVQPTPEGREAWQHLLRNGQIEAAMRIGAPFETDEFQVMLLNREPLHLAVQPSHPLAQQATIAPADLTNETLLLTEPTCTYRIIFEQQLQAAGVVPQAIIEFHAVEAIKQCAMVGLGVAVLPELTIASALRNVQLQTLTWRDADIAAAHQVTTQVIYPKRPPSANLKALLHMLEGL